MAAWETRSRGVEALCVEIRLPHFFCLPRSLVLHTGQSGSVSMFIDVC